MARIAIVAVLILAACSGESTTTDGAPNTACAEAWQCGPWQTNGTTDSATRTCSDQNACGTTDLKPIETATLPALDPEYYECNVEPIVTAGCSMLGCHGTETGRGYRMYARGRLRIAGMTIVEPGCSTPGMAFPSESCTGDIECKCWSVPQFAVERRRSFDSARAFALDDNGNQLADMTQSQLLRQPQTGGGYPHAGISLWDQGDADYNTIKAWLEGMRRGSLCNSKN